MIITTYTRSNKPHKAKYAITLLQKMMKFYDAGTDMFRQLVGKDIYDEGYF